MNLQEDALDAAVVGASNVLRQPILTEQTFDHFHNDVVRLRAGVVVVARQALQARWARGKHLDPAGKAIGAKPAGTLLDLFLLAEANLC